MEAGLRLLGAPGFTTPANTYELPAGQSTHLAAYLALREGWVTRDSVVDLFWPETELKRARHNLSQLLYEIRRAPWAQGIEVESRRLRWEVQTDVARFRRAAADGAWEAAAQSYGGELLEGAVQPASQELQGWFAGERENLRETWCEVLGHGADQLARAGEWSECARLLRRLLKVDSLLEVAVQGLIRAEAMAGRRDAALQAYADFRAALERDLGLEPLAVTSDLASRVRSGELGQDAGSVRGAAEAEARSEEVDDVRPGPVVGLASSSTAFVGRRLELAELHGLLRREGRRLVTIVGPGGTGKTALAAQFAREHAGQHAAGAAWVSLALATSESEAVAAVVDSLSLRIEPGLDALGDVLADRDLFLVLDQVEHLMVAGELVVSLLEAAPELSIMVTSRAALDVPGETVYAVAGLSLPPSNAPVHGALAYDAVNLLMRVAKRVRPDFHLGGDDLAAVLDLTRLLGGNPLGLELAASWLRMLEPRELLSEVQRDLDVLRGDGEDHDLAGASLRAVFESSWSLLAEPEREALRRVAIFRGGSTRESALAVADVAINQLLSLTNRSLLRREVGGRFEPHPIFKQFARKKLSFTPELHGQLEGRHTEYFLALAEDSDRRIDSPEQTTALARLDAEAANIVAVLQRAIRAEDAETANLLVAAMGRPWRWRGRARYGLDWCDKVASIPASAEPTRGRVRLLSTRGSFLELLGDYPAAEDATRQALELAERLGDLELTASSRMNLATVVWRQGDLPAARGLLEQVVGDSRGTGREQQLSAALGNLGTVALSAGDTKTALAHFDKALALAEDLGQVWKTAGVISNRGIAHAYAKDTRSARADFSRALELQRSIDDITGISKTLTNLGVSHLDSGELVEAERYFNEAMPLCAKAGNRSAVADLTINLGIISQWRDDHEAAHRSYARALEIRREIGARGLLAPTLVCFLDLAVQRVQYERALVLAGAAVAVVERCGVPLPTNKRDDLERAVMVAKAFVAPERTAELQRRGAALRDSEAVEFALDRGLAASLAA